MCSISGLIVTRGCPQIQKGRYKQKFLSLLKYGEDRGKDATGISEMQSSSPHIVSLKDSIPAKEYLKKYFSLLTDTEEHFQILLGNNRAQPLPEGDSIEAKNRQPIVTTSPSTGITWAGTHNGTIGNDKELMNITGYKKVTDVDTEAILNAFDTIWSQTKPHNFDLVTTTRIVSSEIAGGFSFALMTDALPNHLVLMKNFKPLWLASISNHTGTKAIFFSSEKKNLVKALEVAGEKHPFETNIKYWEVPAYTGIVLESKHNNVSIETFSIESKHITNIPIADNHKATVICSGGIDSSTAAFVGALIHKREMELLHYDYGQVANVKEIEAVQAVVEKINELGGKAKWTNIKLEGFGKDSPLITGKNLPQGMEAIETTLCWVPARNFAMLAHAAAYSEAIGAKWIYSGFNLEEAGVYPDNTLCFFQKMNEVLDYATLNQIQLALVLERLMKPEIIKLGIHLGVPFDKTWSCDLGESKACGTCGCCTTRRHAFIKAGKEDEQTYLSDDFEKFVWLRKGKWTTTPISIETILEKVKIQK